MRLVIYALPAMAIQFVYVPVATVLPGVFAKYYGVSAGFVALALLLSRVVDAVTDPLVGHYSDLTRSSRFGRKPWIAAGVLTSAATLFLITGTTAAEYPREALLLGCSAFFLGWTMMEVPHVAWAAEVGRDYDARNRVFFVRTVLGMAGALGFAAVPAIVGSSGTEITPAVLSTTAWVFAVAGPVLIGAALLLAPPGDAPRTDRPAAGLWSSLRAVIGNPLLWRLLAGFVLAGLAAGSVGALQFLFVDTYLGLGDRVPQAIALTLVCGVAGMPLWLLVMRRWDKHRAWACSLALAALWVLLPVLLQPGEAAAVPYLLICAGLALSSGAGAIAPFALLGDVADYGAWKVGTRQVATYYALFTFVVKLNAALGGSLAFAVLAATGYDASGTTHGESQVTGIKLAFAVLPALLFAGAALTLWRFPLDRRRHAVLQRALERRPAPLS